MHPGQHDAPTIRKRCLEARRRLTAVERHAASDAIVRQLLRSNLFARSQTIGVYFSMYDEVDLDGFIRTAWACGKKLFAPRILRKHEMFFVELGPDSLVIRNRYGIWESRNGQVRAARTLDWIVVPMVAFDTDMHRIGMGGGYYDRALAFARHTQAVRLPRLTGVAFACQEVAAISANPWDIGVSRVYTEKTSASLQRKT
jgi:5-formyltetrahydrofolate cyclo-ligase